MFRHGLSVQVLKQGYHHVNATFALQAASKVDAYGESYPKTIAEAGCGGRCGGTGVFGFARMWWRFYDFVAESNSFQLF